MTPSTLETNQIAIYFAAVVAGLLIAATAPWAHGLEAAIDLAIAALLYVMFLQVPLGDLRRALANRRFLLALAVANFIAVPAAVLALATALLPDVPVLWLGVLMVLLTPCIDYVVAFTHIARGDAKPLLAATPLLLLAQMLLLPVYLGLFLGPSAAALIAPKPFLHAFLYLIAVPLVLAGLTQLLAARTAAGARVVAVMTWLPVPMTALLLLVVFAAVTPRLGDALGDVARAVPVYLAFALLAPFVGVAVSRLFRLEPGAARAVIFSSSTRNSLVVLPLAFAVPDNGPVVAAIIVTQTLVELASEILYVRWVPRLAPAVA
ncbi:arsenic resistance protein (plasmid) [Pararoseomonas sp. SCSIO 73927]|uniref:arsenic resistance protein n=1 Tax=Pararoseomonas sp. SCSIO 73927 TaxID=3114537 RepID=UPI0030CD6DE2